MSTIEKAELLAGNAAEKTVAFTRNDTLTILKEIPLVELLDVAKCLEGMLNEQVTTPTEMQDARNALAALRVKLPKEML